MSKLYRFLRGRCCYLFLRYIRYRKAKYFFYVNSSSRRTGVSLTHGFSWRKPFISLQKALEFCEEGGIIFIGPGHQEVLDSEISFDYPNITCVGLFDGKDRPTFTEILKEEHNE